MDKSIKISDENYNLICKIAKEERRSRKTIIDIALEDYLKKKGKK